MITITDLNGSKNYMLSTVVKKVVFYVIFLFLFLFALSMFYIDYLGNRMTIVQNTQAKLLAENDVLEKKIATSRAEFEAIEGQIAELEEQFGLDQNATGGSLVNRIVTVSLTGAEERAMFSQIPNGPVVQEKGITAPFGWRDHPILSRQEFHPGLDLRADIGTPVRAPADGVVQYFGPRSGYGYLLEIRHNYGFATRYAHLSKKKVFEEGDFVRKGDIIAYTGNTGLSTGPHLHYEVRFIQRPLDPNNFIKWNSKNYNQIFEKEQKIQWQSLIKMLSSPADKQR